MDQQPKGKPGIPRSAARVAVIGAGPSGLTTVKNLLVAGVPDIVCYEATDAIGGNWVFREGPSHSSVYQTTHIISSKRLSSFEDFPMPDGYPDFPSHRQILDYFKGYAEHFGVMPHVHLCTRLDRARRDVDGRWRLTLSHDAGTKEDIVDALFICTGHHSDPVMPPLPGRFDGEMLHSHGYKHAEPFRGKRVLVIGGGNSACDIAVETARVSALTAMSLRRGYHFLPKVIFGMPADVAFWRLRHLPKPFRQKLAGWLVHLAVGRPAKYGLRERDGRLLEMHPTLNSEFLDALRHGKIHPRADVARVDGRMVRFADGRADEFDVIIMATGYRISFPFLREPFSSWDSLQPPALYLRMMPADIDNLFFIGLFQPLGCIWNLADHQARIAALQITGKLTRPADLSARIEREIRHPHWPYQRSVRHAIEVDFYEFRKALLAEVAKA